MTSHHPASSPSQRQHPGQHAATRQRRRMRNWLIAIAAIAVIVVPLAINGMFSSALSGAGSGLSAVPAAVVNNDTMLTTTAVDGTKSTVFAGRGLMTELTGPGGTGFDWQVTNSAEAEKGLKNGSYYAVLTIPEGFSKQVSSQGTNSASQGLISIKTDDAHGYLAGLVASTVASAVQAGFGNAITAQVVNGVYTSFGTLGTQLSDAASGATTLADGSSALSAGLAQAAEGATSAAVGASRLSQGAGSLADGAGKLSTGIGGYTSGVTELSSNIQGLAQQTAGLGELGASLAPLPGALSIVSGGLTEIADAVTSGSADAEIAALVRSKLSVQGQANMFTVAGALSASASALELSSAAAGLPLLESGITGLAAGSARLDEGSAPLAAAAGDLASGAARLASGAAELDTGVGSLASGVGQSATGAAQLSTGAQQLASGLDTGAAALRANTFADPKAAADVAAKPVKVDVSTDNPIAGVGQILTTIILPAGLWLGALAVFLFLRPLSAALLASAASTARLTARVFARASVFAAAQVLLVVAFLHLGLGIAWTALPATLTLSLLAALSFAAFHQWLATAFGRIGTVVSLILFSVQLASTAGLYPVQILSGPFQVIGQLTPLSYVVDGVRGILAGGSVVPLLTAYAVLAGLLVLSLLLSGFALARRRRPAETGWLTPARAAARPAPAPPAIRPPAIPPPAIAGP